MNDALVFSKTAAGEEAVRERTRLVQRNLRTVLILVDGMADVASLKRQTGDPTMVESALAELETMGLVASPETGTGSTTTHLPHDDELAEMPQTALASGEPDADGKAQFELCEPEEPPIVEGYAGTTDAAGLRQEKHQRHLEAEEEELYERAYGEEDHTQIAMVAPVAEAPVSREARRQRIRPGPLIAIGVIGALILASLRVFLYPYDEYRPEFEKELSRAVGDMVRIGQLRVNFVPRPVIVLEKVSVGDTPYASMEAIRMVPEAASLFGNARDYAEVRLERVRMADTGLGRISHWLRPAGLGEAKVRRLVIEDLALDLGRSSVGHLDGHADLDSRLGIAKIVLNAREGDLRIEAVPTTSGVILDVSATQWRLPSQPSLQLPNLVAKGELSPGRLRLDRVECRAFDGLVGGSGSLGWDRGASLALQLEIQNVAADKLLEALGGPPLLEGRGSAKLTAAASAPSVERLAQGVRLKGPFKVQRGRLRGIDLPGALRMAGQSSGAAVRGGSTAFEEFSGNVSTEPGAIRITGATLASGLLSASGEATIDRREGGIAGAASVRLSGSGARNASILLSGRAASPALKVRR